jgi:transcriptional regulator with XRE-family HTH domain
MSRTQKRTPRITPVAAGTSFALRYPATLRNQEFAHRLIELMKEKELTQSELAKAAFGTYKDKHGIVAVRGRDRISSYVRGLQFPDNTNLELIAKALGVTEAELAPKMNMQAIQNSEPELNIHQIPNSNRVLFTMQKDMEKELASNISARVLAFANVLKSNVYQIPDSPLVHFTVTAEMDQELAARIFAAIVMNSKSAEQNQEILDDFDDDEENYTDKYADDDFLDLRTLSLG